MVKMRGCTLFPRKELQIESIPHPAEVTMQQAAWGLTLGLDIKKRIKQRRSLGQEETLFSGLHTRAGRDSSSLKPTVLCVLLVQDGIPKGVKPSALHCMGRD